MSSFAINPAASGIARPSTADAADWSSDDFESHGASGLLVVWHITQRGGLGASGTTTLLSDAVSSVAVNVGGTNYPDSGAVTFTGGGGGTGASGTYHAVDGVIQTVDGIVGGSGYSGTTTAVFDTGAGSDTQTLSIAGKDEAQDEYYLILASTAVSSAGQRVYRIHPALTASANAIAKDVLPRIFRFEKVPSGSAIFEDSIYFSLIP